MSSLVAERFGLALKEVVKWLELLAVYLITLNSLRRQSQLAALLAALLVAGAGEALYGAYQYATGQGPSAFTLGETLRAYGHFEQPNPFAGYLGTILPFAVALSLLAQPRWLRGLALIAGLALVAGILLSQSRGAWIGVLTALCVMALAGTGRARRLVWPAVYGLLLLTTISMAGLLPASWTARLGALIENFGLFDARTVIVTPDNFALVERMAHWQAGWSMFLDHPLLGVGAGNYPVAYELYSLPGWREALGHAHNYYLNIAAESGLAGLIALLILLVVSYRQVARGVRTGAAAGLERAALLGALGCLVMLTVHNLFDNLLVHGLQVQLGFVLGLIARATELETVGVTGAPFPTRQIGALSSSS
jgi:O-antigen ligase